MESSNRSPSISMPAAVIIAGAIIAVAIIWVKKPAAAPAAQDSQAQESPVDLAPISASDHILGNPNAAVKIVEYSDPSCPFCKAFNPAMEQVMSDYGAGGKVAWVYRHFPLDKPDASGNILHPNAGHEAQGLECAASIGGNDKFWAYEKGWYDAFPQDGADRPSSADQTQMLQVAKLAGIDSVAFSDCLSSGQSKQKIDAQYTGGINAGVSGTPTNFLVLGSSVNQTAVDYINNALIQYRVSPNMLHTSSDKKIIVMAGAMPEALISGLLASLVGKP